MYIRDALAASLPFPSLYRPPAALRERHPLTAVSQVRIWKGMKKGNCLKRFETNSDEAVFILRRIKTDLCEKTRMREKNLAHTA